MKKYIGITLLAIGILAFFYFANEKNSKLTFENRVSSLDLLKLNVHLNAKEKYEFKFWGVDEQMTGVFDQPYFEAQIKILDSKSQILFHQELVSITEIETGGKRVTHDGLSYEYTPQTDEKVTIQVKIKEGDYIDIEAYKNLSSEADALPGLSIILALMGLVLFWRNRVKFRTQQ
jgi:hypothetical protein